jgi:hypothetical protein
MRNAYIVTILLASSLATASEPSAEAPAPALDQLLAQAREAKKPVLLDFSTVW